MADDGDTGSEPPGGEPTTEVLRRATPVIDIMNLTTGPQQVRQEFVVALSDYTGRAGLTAVDLINSYDVMTGTDTLTSGDEAAALLGQRGWVVDRSVSAANLRRLRDLRPRLRFVFGNADVAKSVEDLNRLLRELQAQPQLTDHDGAWHWHYARPKAPLAERVATTCVMALLTAIAEGDAPRLKVCEGVDCANVFIDASRPGSRRFCDSKGCGNRAHVSAYRERKKHAAADDDMSY